MFDHLGSLRVDGVGYGNAEQTYYDYKPFGGVEVKSVSNFYFDFKIIHFINRSVILKGNNMNSSLVLNQYEKLTENYKIEVNDFIEFLHFKMNSKEFNEKLQKRKAFGILKGKIEILSNFDEPIEEFKEYI